MNEKNKAVVQEDQAVVEAVAMDSFDAVGIAEGWIPCNSQEQYLEAWQTLVDTGMAWQLQGWFGRTATALIEAGHITRA